MPRLLALTEHTLFAELLDRSLDAMFDEQFPENGSFVTRDRTNREGVVRSYWYYQGYRPGPVAGEDMPKRYALYVGPADDPAICDRVRGFRQLKESRSDRGRLVDALAGAGMPRPPAAIGRVVEALAKAGVFRLRAVLVGTAAYQTYGGLIGARPSLASATTGDVDVAQFRSVSIFVEDSVSDMTDVLRRVDPSFKPLPGLNDHAGPVTFENAGRFRVDFLTPHRGSDDQMGSPLAMPALGAAAAQPLRFLDYLIHRPVRSVVLYGPGIPVQVPAPERFAVHKLIISNRRRDDPIAQAKARKDVLQAGELIESLFMVGRDHVVAPAFEEAWGRGPEWRRLVERGVAKLPASTRRAMEGVALPFPLPPGGLQDLDPPGQAKGTPTRRPPADKRRGGSGMVD